MRGRRAKLVLFGLAGFSVVALVLCATSGWFVAQYVDYLWFRSLGYVSVFTRRLGTSVMLGLAAMVVAIAFLWFNWAFLARRLAPTRQEKQPPAPTGGRFAVRFGGDVRRPPFVNVDLNRWLRGSFATAAVAVGFLLGLPAFSWWRSYLRHRYGVPFGMSDPIFGLDIGFYLFHLPWYRTLLMWSKLLVLAALIGASLRYIFYRRLGQRGMTAHLSFLGALWLALTAMGRFLARYTLLQSELGVVLGAGYTDIHARMPLYLVESVLYAAAALLLVANAYVRHWRLLLAMGTLWVLLTIFGPVVPAVVQRFAVEPNEFVVERPYIEYNIRYTRYAYGLEGIDESTYPAEGAITTADLEANADVIGNVRLWDYRPLLRTFGQLQEIRLYYTFNDVDVDRYRLDGQLREVMLAARELDVDQLADQAQTWVNRHIIFTHGYGLTMSPVNEVSREGLPRLIVRDIPPVSEYPALTLTRPQIYFGESTKEYAIVNTTEDEFDYPQGDANAYTRYDGPDGVPLGGFFRRSIMALRFGSSQILFSPALHRDSRILFHRTIRERAKTIAPMLWYDPDPYLVIADGHLIWLLDAYTWSDDFPYSEPAPNGQVNYIRNSVKVTVDAYTGEIAFYLVDAEDPIAATYARIFPGLFRPASEMPEVLREHWRYPELLFLYQSRLYATYHMRDPQVFYNREDLWDIPQELVGTETEPMEPYYVLMRTPGSEELEFMLIRPYVPKEKQNMIAWLYADCDGEDYGRLGIFKLSKERMVYGPLQVEARVDQDPVISQQLSLWNQRGSRVLRGNLLVIPIQDTFLYIEPLYLEAEAGQLPELKRVIVAYNDRVAMAPTLSEALLRVLEGAAGEQAPLETGEGAAPTGDLATLARKAWEHYQAAQACLAQGDWACYGHEQDALEEVLRAMVGE